MGGLKEPVASPPPSSPSGGSWGLCVLGGVFFCVTSEESRLAGKEIRAVELNREGNSLESFPESHPALPPEMATTACGLAGLITVLQPWPGDPVTASRAEAGAGVPGHWACGRGCPARLPARPPARLALELGRELSKAVEREVAPAGKQTERLLDFLTGPAACQGRRASSERLPGIACARGLPPVGELSWVAEPLSSHTCP